MLELVRHQAMQDDVEKGIVVNQGNSGANKQIGSVNVTMNAGGMRVVTLAGHLQGSSTAVYAR
jgi:hypothetical protein